MQRPFAHIIIIPIQSTENDKRSNYVVLVRYGVPRTDDCMCSPYFVSKEPQIPTAWSQKKKQTPRGPLRHMKVASSLFCSQPLKRGLPPRQKKYSADTERLTVRPDSKRKILRAPYCWSRSDSRWPRFRKTRPGDLTTAMPLRPPLSLFIRLPGFLVRLSQLREGGRRQQTRFPKNGNRTLSPRVYLGSFIRLRALCFS